MSPFLPARRGGWLAVALTSALLLTVGARAAPSATAVSAALSADAPRAAASRSPPPFHGSSPPAGVLRIWGPKAMSAVVTRWAHGFHSRNPGVDVQVRLMGSDTAIPGLYSGLAQIALMGRRDDDTDDNGFSRPKGYSFKRLRVMAGSLDTEGESPALAILVSARNPLSRLTLAQLAAIAACGCSQASRGVGRWGQLGARGRWSHRPVHLYMSDTASGTGRYFLRVVLGGSRALDWDRVSEFSDRRRADGSVESAAAQTAAALRYDPYGIAVSTVQYRGSDLKTVALSAGPGSPYVLPDRASVISGAYPLARSAYAFVDRRPGHSLQPSVRAFLGYVLGAEGQSDITRLHGYLPLDPRAAAKVRASVCSGHRDCE